MVGNKAGEFSFYAFCKVDKGYKNWDQIHVEFNQKHLKLAHIVCT